MTELVSEKMLFDDSTTEYGKRCHNCNSYDVWYDGEGEGCNQCEVEWIDPRYIENKFGVS